jgi:hypothetical protein
MIYAYFSPAVDIGIFKHINQFSHLVSTLIVVAFCLLRGQLSELCLKPMVFSNQHAWDTIDGFKINFLSRKQCLTYRATGVDVWLKSLV